MGINIEQIGVICISPSSGNCTCNITTATIVLPILQTTITNGTQLLNFMDTNSTYGNIINSVSINRNLISSINKVLTNTTSNIVYIRRIN